MSIAVNVLSSPFDVDNGVADEHRISLARIGYYASMKKAEAEQAMLALIDKWRKVTEQPDPDGKS